MTVSPLHVSRSYTKSLPPQLSPHLTFWRSLVSSNDFANKRDLKTFLSEFRPDINPITSFGLVSIDSGINNQLPAGAGTFANAGIQYVIGLATGVSVELISTGTLISDDELTTFKDQANFLVSQTILPQTIVHGYTELESDTSPQLAESICNAYAQLAARGVSYIVDTGIWGAGGSPFNSQCIQWDPPFPATCPFVTAVGATQFFSTDVDESATSFSGGGFSNIFKRPKYQDTVV
ncbi:Tripeptidyl-peptidase SED2 [Mycena venus]|uniref:Tripeptidyl-peptidase SED2 n=1 Tax=Mycena venus TaxID=2733690 RepID=A0A8H6XKE6_9AGAR|nr:Tripeptidyl-peptidase SED2 [Mycena venus]